jgi:SAM-dependent methyltransferase
MKDDVSQRDGLDELVIKIFLKKGSATLQGWCNICCRPTRFTVQGENLRETVLCQCCTSFNRSRQMRYVLQEEIRVSRGRLHRIRIWNTENSRSLHEHLQKEFGDRYVSSEYFEGYRSGEVVGGILNQDICQSSFPSESFDFILASDVLEHVPDPQKAFRDIRRVLRPNGKLIFTVPFAEGQRESDVRARLKGDGTIEYLKEPLYHGDPLRSEGIPVYTVFGEDLSERVEEEGLRYKKQKLYRPFYGIIGSNAFVFVAEKPPGGPS